MSDLKDMATLITGAASGLGEATARRFVSDGARVLLSDLNETRGQALAKELGMPFIKTDVTDEEQVAKAVERAVTEFGRLDCMINNAGIMGVIGSIRETSREDWRATMAILLDSVFHGTKHAARVMAPQRSGCILNTSSVAGFSALSAHAYTAAKHAVVGLTKTSASELAAYNVRVNAVAPGSVPSRLTSEVFGSEDQARKAAAGKTPIGRPVEAREIAGGFAYLASLDGASITGQVLTIDGGLTGCPTAQNYHERPSAFMTGAA